MDCVPPKNEWEWNGKGMWQRGSNICACVCMDGASVGIFHSFPKMLMVTIKFLMLPILFACILHKMRVFDHTHTCTYTLAHIFSFNTILTRWIKYNKRIEQTESSFIHNILFSFALSLSHSVFLTLRCVFIHISQPTLYGMVWYMANIWANFSSYAIRTYSMHILFMFWLWLCVSWIRKYIYVCVFLNGLAKGKREKNSTKIGDLCIIIIRRRASKSLFSCMYTAYVCVCSKEPIRISH